MNFCARCSQPGATETVRDRWFCSECFDIVVDWITATRAEIRRILGDR